MSCASVTAQETGSLAGRNAESWGCSDPGTAKWSGEASPDGPPRQTADREAILPVRVRAKTGGLAGANHLIMTWCERKACLTSGCRWRTPLAAPVGRSAAGAWP
jgi:hypothetical protein